MATCPHIEDIAAAITPRTRVILVNSPANPTGAVYPRDLLHAIAELCVRHDLLLVSDETYGALTYGDIRNVSPASFPGLRDRTVSIYSFSKEYAMTGWRIGYLTGPAPMLEVMAPVQEAMASCVNAATQRAALAALRGPQDCVETMRLAYQRRRDLVVERLGRIPGVRCPRPDGAFYAFPDVRAITHDTPAWRSGCCSTTGWSSRRARRSAPGRAASSGSPTRRRTTTWPRASPGSRPASAPPRRG